MTPKISLRRWVRGSAAADGRASDSHSSTLARVTRATCAVARLTAVGALGGASISARAAGSARELGRFSAAGALGGASILARAAGPARELGRFSAAGVLSGASILARAARAMCATCDRALFLAVGALSSAAALAQQAQNGAAAAPARPFGAPSVATSAAPSGIASLGQVTLALGLVLALIFVAAWLMRRLKGFGKTGTGALDIVAELPLSQKERAVLIRVGTQQVLLGVAPGRVSTLHVLAEPVSITPPGSSTTSPTNAGTERPTFKSLLMKSLGK